MYKTWPCTLQKFELTSVQLLHLSPSNRERARRELLPALWAQGKRAPSATLAFARLRIPQVARLVRACLGGAEAFARLRTPQLCCLLRHGGEG